MSRVRPAHALRLFAMVMVLIAPFQHSRADSLYFTLPAPLDEHDLKYVSYWLQLSEAQQVAFGAMLGRYQENQRKLFDDRISGIRRLADVGGTLMGTGYTAESVAAVERFYKEQEAYIDALTALDATTLTELMGILSDKQLQLHHHVVLWRQRRRCLMAGWDLRSAGVDLEQLALETFAKNPGVFDLLRESLVEYAQVVTAKYVETDRAALGRSRQGMRIMTDPAIPPDAKAAAMKAMMGAAARQEIRLAQLNAEHVERIRLALPAQAAEQFHRAYREEVFPRSCPDLRVSEGYAGAVLAANTLTAERRADVELRWKTQAAALEQITGQMAEREEQFNRRITAERSFEGSKEYAEFMRDRRLQRWLLHQKYLEELLTLTSEDISADQALAIRASINDIGVLINRAKDDHYPLR